MYTYALSTLGFDSLRKIISEQTATAWLTSSLLLTSQLFPIWQYHNLTKIGPLNGNLGTASHSFVEF